jgi:DNA-binding GntR family transcriptional regulator
MKASRVTVRDAIDDLVTEGLLIQCQGVGTFVSERGLASAFPVIVSRCSTKPVPPSGLPDPVCCLITWAS